MRTYSNKLKEIILHVGLHKTGTKSIQNTLFESKNYTLLKQKDYVYPKCWPSNHSIPIFNAFCDYPENYHINIINGYSSQTIKQINYRNLQLLKNELINFRFSKLILSGEDISSLSLENLLKLNEYLISISNNNEVKIRVVIYVRNPVTWSTSCIQEIIKGGGTYQSGLREVNIRLKNLFTGTISKFSQVFDKKNLAIYSFEDAVSHLYGPVGHFLSNLGFSIHEISKFNIVRANESISQVTGDILSYINDKYPLFLNGKMHEKRKSFDFNPFLNIKGQNYEIPFAQKKELIANCQDDIIWLKENYGIDYSNSPQKKDENINLTSETFNDIKKVYYDPRLSPSLKPFIKEYLQDQLIKSKNNELNFQIRILLNELL